MKKIFTLSVAVAMLAAAQAQNGSGNGNRQNDQQRDQRDKSNGYGKDNDHTAKNYPYDKDDRYNNGNAASERNKGMRIAQVNREYQYKIQRVQSNRFMSRSEKKRQIRLLEAQRLQEIRWINSESTRNRNNDRYDRNDNSKRRY